MALIKCSECGREISSAALACPQCGCPQAISRPPLAPLLIPPPPPKPFWKHKRVWFGLFCFLVAAHSLLDFTKTPEQRMSEQIANRTPIVGQDRANAEAIQAMVNAPGYYNPDPAGSFIALAFWTVAGITLIASALKPGDLVPTRRSVG